MTIFNTSALVGALLLGLTAAQGDVDYMFTEDVAMDKDGKTYCLGDGHTKSEFMKHPQGKTATYY